MDLLLGSKTYQAWGIALNDGKGPMEEFPFTLSDTTAVSSSTGYSRATAADLDDDGDYDVGPPRVEMSETRNHLQFPSHGSFV